jgi:hypothetical protein
LSADGNTAIVGGKYDNGNVGAAWVYTRSGGVWSQQGSKLVGTGAVGAAYQGGSVAVSADGNTAVVGGDTDNGSVGAAWVYTRSGGVWSQQGSKLVGTGGIRFPHQGSSVSLSADGNTLIVGGSADDTGVGAVWVFTRSGGVWSQQGSKLVGTGAVGAADQGKSVSLSTDGNTAVVGGNYDDSNVGAVWVFTRSGGVWSQQGAKLVGTGAVGSPQQGSSVSLSADGNTAVVGGQYDNGNVGATWVYTRSGGVWSQQGAKLVGAGAVGAARQGFSVSLSANGTTAIVGGIGDNSNTGAAWVFVNAPPRIVSITDVPNDQGGKVHVLWNASIFDLAPSYGISSYTLWRQITTAAATQAVARGAPLVGTCEECRGATLALDSGAVRVTTTGTQSVFWEFVASVPARGVSGYGFMAPTTTDSMPGLVDPQQDAMLWPGPGTPRFGCAVAVSEDGNTAIIGGSTENGSVGAAWVYVRSGGVWSQQGAKLVGTGAVGSSQQGASVSLSADGNMAVVGGPADNSNSGAAWVYTRNGGVWSQQGAKLVGTGAVGAAYQGSSVAVSADGNTVIVGGPYDSGYAGAAWVFTRSGSVWSQQGAKLVGTGAVGAAYQGCSVAVSADGNTAVVGGMGDGTFVGAAWVYTRSGGVWSQQGSKLAGTDVVGLAQQGISVAVSADGNTTAIGGWHDSNLVGAAWVYVRSNGVWSQQGAKLVGTGAVGAAYQGSSVSLSADGGTAVVGGPYDNGSVGAAWVFTRSGSDWSQQGAKLVGTGGLGNAYQGSSVAVSANESTVLVGGPIDNKVWVYRAQPPWNVFFVDAQDATSSSFYVSTPDSGYSVDNLSPGQPAAATAAYADGATHLDWTASPEIDFLLYRVYRGNSAGFVPGWANLVAEKPDVGYVDVGPPGAYYKILAVDVHGNQSGFAAVDPEHTTDVLETDGRLSFALEGMYPNPAAGPNLKVRFALPMRAPAQLQLFDVRGRIVVAREVGELGSGMHEMDLTGHERIASGLYFVRLRQGAQERVRRVTVLK